MGGLPRYSFCLLTFWMVMMGSSNLHFVEPRGVPTEWLALPATVPVPDSALIPEMESSSLSTKSRVKRSCEHHRLKLMFLEACNRNYKRSPFIINVIFMEYYIVPEQQEGNDKIDPGTGVGANRELKVPDLDSSNPIISAWIITSENEEEDGKRFQHPNNNGEMDRSLNRLPIIANRQRERPKRVPAAAVNLHELVEKCCSSNGCGSSDFSSLC